MLYHPSLEDMTQHHSYLTVWGSWVKMHVDVVHCAQENKLPL